MPTFQAVISTTALLGNGGVYTSPWQDQNLISADFVEVEAYADQPSAANGLAIQESDDTTNANFTTVAQQGTVAAATLSKLLSAIRKRYWRVIYTNGTTPQGAFELTVGILNYQQADSVGQNGQTAPNASTEIGGIDSNGKEQPVSVSLFHNQDNQALPANANGILTGGVAQILNPEGTVDRQRGTGFDGIPSAGVATGAQQFAVPFSTTIATSIVLNAVAQAVTPASMANIQVGSDLSIDAGANNEKVRVTAVTATTFSAIFSKNHTGPGITVAGFTYNQARDASIGDNVTGTGLSPSATYLWNQIAAKFELDRSANGEQDGASGSGTAVAAEYEFNSGGPAGPAFTVNQFDRARNLQGKGQGSAAITSGGGAGSSTVTLASVAGLVAGAPLYFLTGALGTAVVEVAYVSASYVPGTLAVALQSPLQSSHGTNVVAWDIYAPAGPGLSGFQPTGVGIEEEALWDPKTQQFYLERAATQDAVPSQNVVLETPGLFNGAADATSIDRGRSASAANLAAKSGVGVELTAAPGNWSSGHTPAAATQATTGQAAGGAGVRHVCTSISATLAAGATAQAAAVQLNLRDGASGAGTILWSKQVILPANGLWEVNLSGLAIVGSAATAMTLEFSAAGAAGTFESVALTGYDAQ